MSDYVLGSDAVLDLEDIWDYIATDSMDAADWWIAKLFDAFETIARNPGIGHKREELTDYEVLFWTVGAYLIIYRTGPRHPFTVEIVDAMRQVPAPTFPTCPTVSLRRRLSISTFPSSVATGASAPPTYKRSGNLSLSRHAAPEIPNQLTRRKAVRVTNSRSDNNSLPQSRVQSL